MRSKFQETIDYFQEQRIDGGTALCKSSSPVSWYNLLTDGMRVADPFFQTSGSFNICVCTDFACDFAVVYWLLSSACSVDCFLLSKRFPKRGTK